MELQWHKIYTTCSEAEAYLIKGFLEGEGFACMVKSQRVPQIPLTVNGLGQIDIYLIREEMDSGLAALDEYIKNTRAVENEKRGKIIYPRFRDTDK